MLSHYLGRRRPRKAIPRIGWRDGTPPMKTPPSLPHLGLEPDESCAEGPGLRMSGSVPESAAEIYDAHESHNAAATLGRLLQPPEERGGGSVCIDVAGLREDPSLAINRIAPNGSCRSIFGHSVSSGLPTQSRPLFLPQGNQRVDARSAPSREGASEKCDGEQ